MWVHYCLIRLMTKYCWFFEQVKTGWRDWGLCVSQFKPHLVHCINAMLRWIFPASRIWTGDLPVSALPLHRNSSKPSQSPLVPVCQILLSESKLQPDALNQATLRRDVGSKYRGYLIKNHANNKLQRKHSVIEQSKTAKMAHLMWRSKASTHERAKLFRLNLCKRFAEVDES